MRSGEQFYNGVDCEDIRLREVPGTAILSGIALRLEFVWPDIPPVFVNHSGGDAVTRQGWRFMTSAAYSGAKRRNGHSPGSSHPLQ